MRDEALGGRFEQAPSSCSWIGRESEVSIPDLAIWKSGRAIENDSSLRVGHGTEAEAIGREMKGRQFTEEQIIRIPNEAEQIGKMRESCKRSDVTETPFLRWRSNFGGMSVPDAGRLRELEHEAPI